MFMRQYVYQPYEDQSFQVQWTCSPALMQDRPCVRTPGFYALPRRLLEAFQFDSSVEF